MTEVIASHNKYWKRDEVVEPSREIYRVADVGQKEGDLVGCPAYDESAAYHQRCDNCVASDGVCSSVSTGPDLVK